MKTNNELSRLIENYRSIESKAHVNLDDVLNKVTQEVAELVEAVLEGNTTEIGKEAGDAIVNVISASFAMGVEFEDESGSGKLDPANNVGLLLSLGRWNQRLQALRGRYSRDEKNLEKLSESTKEFVSLILSYVNEDVKISDILLRNTQKFESRYEKYLPSINLKEYIDDHQDFPKAGILFKDISPLLKNEEAMRHVSYEIAERCRGADVIAGLDARGFLFGTRVSEMLGKPFVMIRKKGKLPGKTVFAGYSLEYGQNEIEMQESAIEAGQKVALIDDLLATGGTMLAASRLVERAGGIVDKVVAVISLEEDALRNAEARKTLESSYSVEGIVSY